MKVLCNACEAAEAVVMCCADEAALCLACDERVHAANKLAGKHQRISLISSSSSGTGGTGGGGGASCSVPKCDICQEAFGYFFCLEDRALLCRNCDMSIHSANPYVSSHQRFLLAGVQVGLEPSDNAAPSTTTNQPNQNSNSTPENSLVEKPLVVPPPIKSFQKSSSISMSGQVSWDGNLACMTNMGDRTSSLHEWSVFNEQQFSNKRSSNMGVNSNQVVRDGNGMAAKAQASGSIFGGAMPDWPLDEFFGLNEFNSGFGFPEHGFSKADSGKLGSSQSSSQYRSSDEEMEAMGYLGQVPEISSWTVPEMPSPPTASGLHWQGNVHHVPDILSDSPQKNFTSAARLKSRRRHH